jgi:hypothetical protein
MHAHRLLKYFFGLVVALSQTHALMAADAVIRLEIISVTKVTAMGLLDDPRMVSDPATMLKSIESLKTRREAEEVATSSLRGTLPFRTKANGKVFVEVDVGGALDKLVYINIAVESGKPKQATRLVTTVDAKAGTPKFLGTLEPLEPADKERTWLVFLHVQ